MRLLLLSLLIALTACQSSRVTIDYDTSADFKGIHTYQWLTETSGLEEGFDPLIAERTRNAVATNLQKIPLQPVAANSQPDILVRYYVGSVTRSKESNSRGSIGFGSAGGNAALGISLSFPLGGEKITKEAQIIVDFVSPSDKKLKWRGTNLIEISDESPEQISTIINSAVAEIFSHYPPGKEN